MLSIISYFLIEQPARKKQKINFKKLSILILFFIFLIVSFSISIIKQNGFPSRFHELLNIQKFSQNHRDFEMNYNYDNFSEKKNMLIVGNSVAEDLQKNVYFSDELNRDYYSYVFSQK